MKRLLAAVLILGALTLATAPATASAATTGPATAGGFVRLYENPDFTGSVRTVPYQECGAGAALLAKVGAFDNRPPAGCEVVLAKGSQTFELCVGRGTVPVYFRTASVLRIRPGSSLPCSFAGASGVQG